MIFSFYFQYAGSKSLPLNYTSMAENFYSQSLSSLSSWGRGLNPDEVITPPICPIHVQWTLVIVNA